MLSKMKLSAKILLLGIAIVGAFSLFSVWVYRQFINSLYDAKYLKTKHVVETAAGVVQHYVNLEKLGSISGEEARLQAQYTIVDMRYDTEEYFWINDVNARMIIHPINMELNGQDVGGQTDPDGKPIFRLFAETARKNGAGFVEYQWAKPGFAQPVSKISYVQLIPDWG